jgi:hypothetical protein
VSERAADVPPPEASRRDAHEGDALRPGMPDAFALPPKRDAAGLSFLDQLPLFGFDDLAPPRARAADRLPLRATRPRGYDRAVLRYVAYYRLVTLHQVIYRFFVFDAKSASYGFKLVRRLVREGWLGSVPLDSERGSISRQVLSITPLGWLLLNARPPKQSRSETSRSVRDYRLQFAEMMLEREADGWRLAPSASAFGLLREWALAPYRGRLLNDDERVIRQRIERAPAVALPLNVLVRSITGDVRLILPIRSGRSFGRLLESLPPLNFFPPLEFEAVCSELELLSRAEEFVGRWSRDRGAQVRLHRVEHFRSRVHPGEALVPSESRYRTNGVGDPRKLV